MIHCQHFLQKFSYHRNQLKDFPSYRLCAAAVFRTNLFKSPFSLASNNTKWCIHKSLHRTQIPVKGKVCLRHLWRCCDSDSLHNSLTRLDLGTKGCRLELHPDSFPTSGEFCQKRQNVNPPIQSLNSKTLSSYRTQ